MIDVTEGESPLILGFPHSGIELTDRVRDRLNADGKALTDTDWHIDALYAQLGVDVTHVCMRVHRYVIDVNRDPKGTSLYPGYTTTSLCPTTNFDGDPIYRTGCEPTEADIQERLVDHHEPYHRALSREVSRIKRRHGYAILLDCHSIRSKIPCLFDGRLPDFNIGDNDGTTCAADITQRVREVCGQAHGYTSVVNGRFKGGWTTRQYGRPHDGIHAIQIELAQSTYMNETPPWAYRDNRAHQTRCHLRKIVQTLSGWRPE